MTKDMNSLRVFVPAMARLLPASCALFAYTNTLKLLQSRILKCFGYITLIAYSAIVFADPTNKAILNIGGNEIYLEKIITPSEQARGLSYRKNLPDNHGMLFIFPKEKYLTFWMKDMNFPLDIIWLNKNNEVVDISLNQKPCKPAATCPLISPKIPAQSVLEANVGFVKKYGIKTGQKLEMVY